MSSHWDTSRLYSEIIGDREMCVKWCEENGLIPTRCMCIEGHEMHLKTTDSFVGYFICSKKHSSGKFIRFTRMRGTVFETRRMPPQKFLCLIHCFVNDISYRNGALECSIGGDSTSKTTVAECYNLCREMITCHLLGLAEDFSPIGGPGKNVEIIELTLEQRKFSLGSFDEGTIVVIMIEQDTKEYLLKPYKEEEFCVESICEIIKQNILPHSIIVPCVHRDFSSLSNEEFTILNAEDPNLKQFEKLSRGGVDKFLEYLFKSDMRKKELDIFEEIIDIIRHTFPLKDK